MRIALALLLVALALAPASRAETTVCTEITSVPAVITSAGIYCLHRDFSTAQTTGAAITIEANNVVLDCNHRRLGGLAAGPGSTASGIHALGRSNILIRNCLLRGFGIGINLYGFTGDNQRVEDNRIESSYGFGIVVYGDGKSIRGNSIFDTGGSTQYTSSHAIFTEGTGDIIDNSISGVSPSTQANQTVYGIFANVTYGEISFNRITGVERNGTGASIAILANGGKPVVRDNSIINLAIGQAGDRGIACSAGTIVRDNAISGYSDPALPVSAGCTSSGNTTAP